MAKNLHGFSDEKLASLCKTGDEEAYGVLVGRYLFAVRSRAGGYNASDIDFEDLVQEGFIGLVNAVNNYQSSFNTAFSTFAFLCIDRNIITAVRKSLAKKQIPKSALVCIDDSPELEGGSVENPENVIISREGVDFLRQKISDKLSKMEKKVLDYYLAGYSYEKISGCLDCSVKSVDNAVQRIRKKLK